MSVYHNYNESSKKYDAARFAMAGEAVNRTVKQVATQLELPADRLVGAEVGCGTGNYTVAMAEAGVGTVHALDHSAGMLDKLQKKVDESGEDSPLRKSVRVGAPIDLAAPDLALPFDDNSVHLVLIPQVTHHLVKDSESDPFAAVKRLVQEVARVIAPGGALLIQTQTPTQHRSGFWWADIIPRAAARLAKRFCEVDTWSQWLGAAGFALPVISEVPPHPLVKKSLYADVTGPFRAEFRGWDSTWSLATQQELDIGLQWFQQMVDAGRAEDYLAEREAIRAKIGQTTTVIAFKPQK